MKKFFLLNILMALPLTAQVYELGIGGGSATMISDLGTDSFYLPDGYFVGGLYRVNSNEWFSVRLNLNYAFMGEYDYESESAGRRKRRWYAETRVYDINLMVEYNFLPANPYKRPDVMWITPYIAGGLGAYVSDLKMVTSAVRTIRHQENAAFLPLAAGLKVTFRNRMKLIWEIKPQYSFKDNMEGSIMADSRDEPKTNRLANDWFIYNGISLTFGWGKLPCYLNLF